ncbi:ABC transporter permease [Streptomyces sp. NPDC001857]|uniref:ABC transporter permease n=1 Tax=unclassified Streptomyces TaxID=2593676 RepID=UPI003325F997
MSVTVDPAGGGTATHPGPPHPRPPHSGRRRPGAVLALARFETRELLLQIPVLVFLALYAGVVAVQLMHYDGMDDFPVLHTVDRDTQSAPLLLALALLVCTNAAALRSRKHGTVQQFDTLAMEPWRRDLAHLLSVLPFAALTAVAVGVRFAREALKPGAIGHGSLGELAVGPLTVLLAGVLGVVLTRVVPTPFAPILFVVAAYLLVVIASATAGADGEGLGRLSPVLFSGNAGGDPVPADLLGRPAGWHALYVLGLCAVLACAALLRSGGRTGALKAVTALALAATVAGALGQGLRDTAALEAARRTASTSPQKVQTCTTAGGSTYCSFPDWESVRDDWAEVVERVRSSAGGTAANTPLTVRQRIDATGDIEADTALTPSGTPGEVTVGTRWGGNRVPEFAVGVATVLVAGTEDATMHGLCGARGITVMWLVLATDPTPRSTFRNVRLDDSDSGPAQVLAPTEGLSLTEQQTTVIQELLTRPRAEISPRVKANWQKLTSAQTTTAEAAELLGVAAPKGAEQCEE